MKYKIYNDRIKLIGSHLVSKKNFFRELVQIGNLHPSCGIWKRSVNNIRREWAAHNLAYSLGIRRDRTADVDLNFEQRWYEKLGYFIVGSIALLVIK